MKRLTYIIAAAALLFSTQTTIAQEDTVEANPVTMSEEFVEQATYKAIEVSDVAAEVIAAVEKDFSGATIAEAYTDEEGNFKLVIVLDKDSKTVYTNAAGEWIEPNE